MLTFLWGVLCGVAVCVVLGFFYFEWVYTKGFRDGLGTGKETGHAQGIREAVERQTRDIWDLTKRDVRFRRWMKENGIPDTYDDLPLEQLEAELLEESRKNNSIVGLMRKEKEEPGEAEMREPIKHTPWRVLKRDLLEALRDALAIITDPKMGTWSYMESGEFYEDMDAAAKILTKAIAKAEGRTE